MQTNLWPFFLTNFQEKRLKISKRVLKTNVLQNYVKTFCRLQIKFSTFGQFI